MADALGMIETRSFPAVVEAADAMVKAAKVELVTYEKTGGGYVTVDRPRRRGGREGGVRRRRRSRRGRVGEVVAVHVIARPHVNVDLVMPLGRAAEAKASEEVADSQRDGQPAATPALACRAESGAGVSGPAVPPGETSVHAAREGRRHRRRDAQGGEPRRAEAAARAAGRRGRARTRARRWSRPTPSAPGPTSSCSSPRQLRPSDRRPPTSGRWMPSSWRSWTAGASTASSSTRSSARAGAMASLSDRDIETHRAAHRRATCRSDGRRGRRRRPPPFRPRPPRPHAGEPPPPASSGPWTRQCRPRGRRSRSFVRLPLTTRARIIAAIRETMIGAGRARWPRPRTRRPGSAGSRTRSSRTSS